MQLAKEILQGIRAEDTSMGVNPTVLLPLKMLYASMADAVHPRHFHPWGEPGPIAREAYAWLWSTTGTRRFPVLSSDYCLHIVEYEVRRRTHRLCGQRHRTVEEYRACLVERIQLVWQDARQHGDPVKAWEQVMHQLEKQSAKAKQGILFDGRM